MGRTRLSPEQRRAQLLEIGAGLFAGQPYEEVWIEEVAERAGVSRGLLYHYFPTKRDFYVAVIAAQAEELAKATAYDPDLPLADQMRVGMDAYLDLIERAPESYRALYHGLLSADAELKSILDHGNQVQADNILAAAGAQDNALARFAVRNWLTFAVAACLDWQEKAEVTRDELRDLCVDSLLQLLHFATTR